MFGYQPLCQLLVVILVRVLLGRVVIGNQPLAVVLLHLLLSGVDIGNQPLAVVRIIRVVSNGRRIIVVSIGGNGSRGGD